MRHPRYVSSLMLQIGELSPEQACDIAAAMTSVRGVAEATVIAEEGIAYLKVDRKVLDEAHLEVFMVSRPSRKGLLSAT